MCLSSAAHCVPYAWAGSAVSCAVLNLWLRCVVVVLRLFLVEEGTRTGQWTYRQTRQVACWAGGISIYLFKYVYVYTETNPRCRLWCKSYLQPCRPFAGLIFVTSSSAALASEFDTEARNVACADRNVCGPQVPRNRRLF